MEGMLYMSSTCSNDGSYRLTVTFEVGTDLDKAQVLVQNRLAVAQPRLPQEVQRQGVTAQKQSTNFLMAVALTSPDRRYDELFLGNYATLRVKNVLSRIRGVGDVRRLRRQPVRHADLARPGEAQGPRPLDRGRPGGDPRAERPGGRRPGRASRRRRRPRGSSTT